LKNYWILYDHTHVNIEEDSNMSSNQNIESDSDLNIFKQKETRRLISRDHLHIILELILILFWALYVGKEYLDFNPNVIPGGHEFSSVVASHHFWTLVKQCGWCAVWDGTQHGGVPALMNIYAGILHPILMLSTLLWGVINGTKVTVVASLFFAGLAQWALARELNLSRLPRIWSAAMVIVGGHLAGRMEIGLVSLVLSSAMCSLVFFAVLAIARRGGPRAIVLLAVTTASAILSGQGYIQAGLIATLPAFAFLLLSDKLILLPIWKDYAKAGAIAVLLAAPLLLPFANHYNDFTKYADTKYIHAQPITYALLNLVIDDIEFLRTETLSKYPYPNVYALFIGWVPVILGLIGLSMKSNRVRKQILYLAGSAGLVFIFASPSVMKWLGTNISVLNFIRIPPYMLGLSITPILGIAAYGLDQILSKNWPVVNIGFANMPSLNGRSFSLKWLLLIPLLISLNQGLQFSRYFFVSGREDANLPKIFDYLKTPYLQWVQTPHGEHFWIEPAISYRLKLSPGISPWRLAGREYPTPKLESIRLDDSDRPGSRLVAELGDIKIFSNDAEEYAAIINNDGQKPCRATGSGGTIDVVCESTSSGRLVVKENMLGGWKAWRNGERTELLDEEWLEVKAPSGNHTFTFRYLPWDVPLGLVLCVVGILFCLWLWIKKS
jgi:hypothetical protein